MYSFIIKQKIENKIQKGENLESISQETQVPIATLEKWGEELKIRKVILDLIKENKFEEAKIELEKLNYNLATKLSLESLIAQKNGDIKQEKELLEKALKEQPDNAIIISRLIIVARKEEDIERQKELLEKILEIEPDDKMALKSLLKIAQDEQNVEKQKELLGKILEIDQKDFKSISSLISIARKEGNLKLEKDLLKKILRIYPENVKALSSLALIARKERNSKEEKRILEKILELEPQNLKTLSSLSLIARKEKDIKAEKEILSKILQIDPKNVKAMSSLIRIARQEKNIEEESKLLHRQLEIDPDNRIVIKGLEEIGEEKDEDLFTRKHTGPVQNARTLIAKSDAKDMLNVISKIKELIENEDPTLKVLVQAEAATKAKLFKQAEGYLKAHKKISKDNANALKVLKKAFVIVQSKNKLYDELKWQEIYDEYERLIGITNCGETHPDEEGR